MTPEEERAMREQRRKSYMEQDYNPGYTPGTMPQPEHRVANALEYIAYQMGQINRHLARIAADHPALKG